MEQGQWADAWRLGGQVETSIWTQRPCNALLAAEITRAMGRERRYRAIVRLARRRWPAEPHVFLEWLRQSRVCAADAGVAELDARKAAGDIPVALHALADAVAASLLARADRIGLARARLVCFGDVSTIGDPRVAYEIGHAWAALRQWPMAISALHQAVRCAPTWPRARASLARALLEGGAPGDARRVLDQDAMRRGDEPHDYLAVFLYAALNDVAASCRAASDYLLRWPSGDARAMVASWAFQAASLTSDRETVRAALAQGEPWLPSGALADADRLLAAPRRLLSLAPLCQAPQQCVPTAAAMVTAWHGDPDSSESLSAALGGVAGVEMWRLGGHFEARGYRAEYVRMTGATLRALLDRGLPVIGLIDTLFSSHVDVICGYDAGTGLFYRRDPEHWALAWSTAEELEALYGSGGGVGMVLVPPARCGEPFNPAWRHTDAMHLDRLRQACATGDIEAAGKFYALIGDDSAFALQRSQAAHGIVESAGVFGKKLLRVLQNMRLPALIRCRALLMVSEPSVFACHKRELLERLPGRAAALLLDGVEHAAAQRWLEAGDSLSRLTSRFPLNAQLWLRLAHVQWQAGATAAARHSARMALEASPHALYVATRVAELFPDMYGRADQLRRWRLLRRRQPGSYAAVMAEADARECGRQGRPYERALRRCIAYAPLQARHYDRLAKWYFAQGLPDCARTVLDQARQRLGPAPSPWSFGQGPVRGLPASGREHFENWVRGVCQREGATAAIQAVQAHREQIGESTAVALAAMLYVDHGNADAACALLDGHQPADALDAQHAQITRARLALLKQDYAVAEQIFLRLRAGTPGG